MKARKGFTVIELVLVMGLIAIFSIITFVGLSGRKGRTELDSVTKQIVSTLREAQSKSVSQVNSATWGVHFDNNATKPSFSTFQGSSFAFGSSTVYYPLSTNVAYVTSTLNVGWSRDVVFSQMIGSTTSTVIAVYLKSSPNISSTISVATSGNIGY